MSIRRGPGFCFAKRSSVGSRLRRAAICIFFGALLNVTAAQLIGWFVRPEPCSNDLVLAFPDCAIVVKSSGVPGRDDVQWSAHPSEQWNSGRASRHAMPYTRDDSMLVAWSAGHDVVRRVASLNRESILLIQNPTLKDTISIPDCDTALGWPTRSFVVHVEGMTVVRNSSSSPPLNTRGGWVETETLALSGYRIPVGGRVLAFRPIWTGFVVNTLFLSMCVGVAWTVARSQRSKFRRRRMLCVHCGCDRQGMDAMAVCPECGGVPTAISNRQAAAS